MTDKISIKLEQMATAISRPQKEMEQERLQDTQFTLKPVRDTKNKSIAATKRRKIQEKEIYLDGRQCSWVGEAEVSSRESCGGHVKNTPATTLWRERKMGEEAWKMRRR